MKKNSEFQDKIEEHLVKFKENKQFLPALNPKKKWQYYDISDNLYPPLKHGFLQYAYDNSIPFHDYVNHVRSSQVFGFNLFYPILKNEQQIMLNKLSELSNTRIKRLESFSFEYSPERDMLGEWKSSSRPDEYVTAVDLAIFTEDAGKDKYGFLLEVKFTEKAFSSCGGYNSGANKGDVRAVCENREKLFEDFNRCFLQIRSRGKSPRKYFNYFKDLKSDFPNLKETKVCPFQNNHQCLRNTAFARALKDQKGLKKCFYGLIYHDNNKEIEQAWESYHELASRELRKELFSIKASEIIQKSSNQNLKNYFKERYLIDGYINAV